MNMRAAIKRHDAMASAFALLGKAKLARLHLIRAEELRTALQINREVRHVASRKECIREPAQSVASDKSS